MAKPKFNLSASPTFKAKVLVPIAGAKPAEIEVTFKHRTRDAFKEFVESLADRNDDVDVILDIASGWDLDDAFDKDSLEELTQNHIGSARAIIEAYMGELTSARVKN